MIEFLSANWDKIMLVVTSLVTAASIIVKLTPTPKDDEVLSKVVKLLNVVAINPKASK